jgi:hypothetical protein
MQDGPANFGAQFVNLSEVQFTPELVGCIPAKMARDLRIIPIYQRTGRIGIVFADPSNLNAINTLTQYLNQEVEVLVADGYQLETLLGRLYGDGKSD